MGQFSLTVFDLLNMKFNAIDDLKLHCIGGRSGIGRKILSPQVNRPGLVLSGFFENFKYQGIQVFGNGEVAYLKKLAVECSHDSVKRFFEGGVSCVVVTSDNVPPQFFINLAEESRCSVLQTSLSSSEFTVRVLRIFSNLFAERKVRHGVLMSVFGVGVLLLGKSGVGKSESALELVERGHCLVADDLVELRRVNGSTLVGQSPKPSAGHHIEIRGIGIINIARLYGVGAIADKCTVQLVVELVPWTDSQTQDRIGADNATVDILEIPVPYLSLPVKPGRNIPILIETAAKNERLKSMGYFSAKEFNKNVLRWMEADVVKNAYGGYEEYY